MLNAPRTSSGEIVRRTDQLQIFAPGHGQLSRSTKPTTRGRYSRWYWILLSRLEQPRSTDDDDVLDVGCLPPPDTAGSRPENREPGDRGKPEDDHARHGGVRQAGECVTAKKDHVPIVTTWNTPKMSSTVE